MSDLREAAQHALEALEEIADEVFSPYDNKLGDAIRSLRAALAQEQTERKQLIEKVRVRIMQTALDCADDAEIQSYNGVKVMCSDVVEMLK